MIRETAAQHNERMVWDITAAMFLFAYRFMRPVRFGGRIATAYTWRKSGRKRRLANARGDGRFLSDMHTPIVQSRGFCFLRCKAIAIIWRNRAPLSMRWDEYLAHWHFFKVFAAQTRLIRPHGLLRELIRENFREYCLRFLADWLEVDDIPF